MKKAQLTSGFGSGWAGGLAVGRVVPFLNCQEMKKGTTLLVVKTNKMTPGTLAVFFREK